MTVCNAIHPTARIGAGTTIWHWAVILQDAVIGKECSIGSFCEVGRGCIIGDRTRLSHGVFLPPESAVGSDVFIGPGAIFTDDRFPRVRQATEPHYRAQPPLIGNGASIGAGAVILPGVVIGQGALIAAGAVVTSDVPAGVVVRGEPARLRYPMPVAATLIE